MQRNQLVQVVPTRQAKRIPRKPQHTFNIEHYPFALQPFMIAPVLAGETLTNLQLQARVVSDAVKNPLIGWWQEYYFFYVKLRDLDDPQNAENMLLDQSYDLAGDWGDASVDEKYYHHSGINWLKRAVSRITQEYFRDEGELPADFKFGEVPIAQITNRTWLDSVYPASELVDETVDVDATPTPDNISLSDFDLKWQKWNLMRKQQLTEMDFEDYLATFGVRQNLVDTNRPELIRYVRQWSYPSNTINPSPILDSADEVILPAGAPTSALSYSISERGDKDRYFSEPGFIIGISLARPKVYIKTQRESASHLMKDAMTWLPQIMADDPSTSLVLVPQDTGPLGGVYDDEDYWVDVRDLLIYGDQFLNYELTATDKNLIAVPIAASDAINSATKYPILADVIALFADPAKAYFKADGVVSLNILGSQQDHT